MPLKESLKLPKSVICTIFLKDSALKYGAESMLSLLNSTLNFPLPSTEKTKTAPNPWVVEILSKTADAPTVPTLKTASTKDPPQKALFHVPESTNWLTYPCHSNVKIKEEWSNVSRYSNNL